MSYQPRQRLVYYPTRNRRLNEMLGFVLFAAATLLTLALVSYTPSDPSLNTVASTLGAHPAHNWVGLFGAYTADALLQTAGVAVFFLPLVFLRVGISWMRSRAVGHASVKLAGIALWLIAAPLAIALVPTHALYRNALPLSGLVGSLLAATLVHLVNLPGAAVLSGLLLLLSLYLVSTFLLAEAGSWFSDHLAPIRALRTWFTNRRHNTSTDDSLEKDALQREGDDPFGRDGLQPVRQAAAEEGASAPEGTNSLHRSFFSWFSRKPQPADEARASFVPDGTWQNLPPAPVEALAVAPASMAVALPLTEALPSLPFDTPAATAADDNWLDSPERNAPAPMLPRTEAPGPQLVRKAIVEGDARFEGDGLQPVHQSSAKTGASAPEAMPSPMADIRDQNIAFGKRADADLRPVAMTAKSVRGYKLPASSLLYRSDEHADVNHNELREQAQTLRDKCAEFGVSGQVEQINPGPVVTTFEFRPDAGVKYARVTALQDDLCLGMAAESVLIERIPGKSTVGIQIPNRTRETIWLRDTVECESFAQSKSRLPIALGKDINGRIVTADLAAMPHVLIAGSTGSGKSVAINAMIMSVLMKSTPEQVRMILVDPKRVELGMYEGIPHLFTPIITEAKLAANALRNAVKEMERRLKLLAANHVRNIDQFNKLFESGSGHLFDDVNQEPLPYLMIVIDELADLMMLDRANVEEAITRLAQMARAVGIHLVLATQRPSVDVITGLIKANVPTRMSFRLATKVDSRTIIDTNGAESLLGRGDMLFLPPGSSRLQRVHAPFVTEKEIAAVTDFWKQQGEAQYAEGFLEGPKDDKGNPDGFGDDAASDNDPMFDDAVRLVYEFGKASTSLLQRRLRIGYGRAASLIDMMERDGLVGPAEGSKPRELLKPQSFYSEMDAALR